jgi:general secretion pathway protein M
MKITHFKSWVMPYWSSRSVQERRAVLVAAVIVLPALFYLLLWHPAHVAVEKLQRSVPTLRAQAAHMREQVTEVEALRHRPQPAQLESGNLKAAIEESAQRQLMKDALNSLTVQDNSTVRITMDSVSFAQWLKWLHELQHEQHIRAESVSIAALAQPGLVAVSATLTNGTAQ